MFTGYWRPVFPLSQPQKPQHDLVRRYLLNCNDLSSFGDLNALRYKDENHHLGFIVNHVVVAFLAECENESIILSEIAGKRVTN